MDLNEEVTEIDRDRRRAYGTLDKIQARELALKGRVRGGETTGDRLLDFALATGGGPGLYRAMMKLQKSLRGKTGKPILFAHKRVDFSKTHLDLVKSWEIQLALLSGEDIHLNIRFGHFSLPCQYFLTWPFEEKYPRVDAGPFHFGVSGPMWLLEDIGEELRMYLCVGSNKIKTWQKKQLYSAEPAADCRDIFKERLRSLFPLLKPGGLEQHPLVKELLELEAKLDAASGYISPAGSSVFAFPRTEPYQPLRKLVETAAGTGLADTATVARLKTRCGWLF